MQKGTLDKHQLTHTSEQNFECSICKKRFKSTRSLKEHNITQHLTNEEANDLSHRVFPCIFCNKIFAGSDKLRRHVRTHTGEKPFECTFCGKGFADKRNLQVHEKIHRDDRPNKCEICGKRFIHPRDLRRHIDTCHGKNKPTPRKKRLAHFEAPSTSKEQELLYNQDQEYMQTINIPVVSSGDGNPTGQVIAVKCGMARDPEDENITSVETITRSMEPVTNIENQVLTPTAWIPSSVLAAAGTQQPSLMYLDLMTPLLTSIRESEQAAFEEQDG